MHSAVSSLLVSIVFIDNTLFLSVFLITGLDQNYPDPDHRFIFIFSSFVLNFLLDSVQLTKLATRQFF